MDAATASRRAAAGLGEERSFPDPADLDEPLCLEQLDRLPHDDAADRKGLT